LHDRRLVSVTEPQVDLFPCTLQGGGFGGSLGTSIKLGPRREAKVFSIREFRLRGPLLSSAHNLRGPPPPLPPFVYRAAGFGARFQMRRGDPPGLNRCIQSDASQEGHRTGLELQQTAPTHCKFLRSHFLPFVFSRLQRDTTRNLP